MELRIILFRRLHEASLFDMVHISYKDKEGYDSTICAITKFCAIFYLLYERIYKYNDMIK